MSSRKFFFLLKHINNARIKTSSLEFQIEREGGINGEAGKNTVIRNFIEIIKRPYDNINKKNIRNTKVVYLHEASLLFLLDSPFHATSCCTVVRKQFCAMWKKQHVQQPVLWFCLGFTLPLSTMHMN